VLHKDLRDWFATKQDTVQ